MFGSVEPMFSSAELMFNTAEHRFLRSLKTFIPRNKKECEFSRIEDSHSFFYVITLHSYITLLSVP